MYALMYMYYHINFTGGQASYRTNLMYVQAEEIEVHRNVLINIPKKRVREEVCKNQPKLKYLLDSDASLQRKRMFFHSFYRNTINASYTLFRILCIYHKAYFDVTLPTPPNKTTVYDVMEKCRKAAEFKSMLFFSICRWSTCVCFNFGNLKRKSCVVWKDFTHSGWISLPVPSYL